VTAQNFLKILNGSATEMKGIGSGKVINSNADDNVFVYYSDHGATGLVAMPVGDYLYANDLIATLKQMSADKKFNKLVFYLEACESGSMFEGLLPDNISIYATTASSATESSYAYYYDATRQTYLGDEYSVKWMEDSDAEDESAWTLDQQFTLVKQETQESHVQRYGDTTMGSLAVQVFQTFQKAVSRLVRTRFAKQVHADAVDSRDVKASILMHRFLAAKDAEEKSKIEAQLLAELKGRAQVENLFKTTVARLTTSAALQSALLSGKAKVIDFGCLKKSMSHILSSCPTIDQEYLLKYVQVVVNVCENKMSVPRFHEAITSTCASAVY